MMSKIIFSLWAIVLLSLPSYSQAVKVEIKEVDGGYQLYRAGEPYYIKGAGGQTNLDLLVELGGNSIRTWSIGDAAQVLDEAEEKGLTVMFGFWVGQERQGFDYSDTYAVEDQFKRFREAVRMYKDHPALLLWGIGNENDLFYTDFTVWDAVQDIAKMIHEEDPNHPTSVVTAGIDVAEVQMIRDRAPDIDILGINTYGDLPRVGKQIRLYGWDKPYLISEWGPTGHWEVPKTSWGVAIEQSSNEKAEVYRKRYTNYISKDKKCLGSYVFLWGQKQETTPTWYGLFLESGESTDVIDELSLCWNGKYPDNRAPKIKSFTLDNKEKEDNIKLVRGKKYPIQLEQNDPDGDAVQIEFEILPESVDIKAGGDKEARPEPIPGLTSKNDSDYVLRAPRKSGSYRIFIYVTDGKNHAATDNIPFYVD